MQTLAISTQHSVLGHKKSRRCKERLPLTLDRGLWTNALRVLLFQLPFNHQLRELRNHLPRNLLNNFF